MTPENPPQETEGQSLMKSLFAGKIEENLTFPFPEISEDEKEVLTLLCDNLRRYAKDNIDTSKIDEEERIPDEVMEALKEMGLFSLMIPEEYGGAGLSQAAYAQVFEVLGSIDNSIAVTLGAHQSIGMKALLLYGNEDQKKKYLPKLASGEWIAAFALTEPGAGSDAYSIQTKAEKLPDGNYKLNGNKLWITNGDIADFFTIFAKTEEDTPKGKKEKVTGFIVAKGMEGFSVGKREHKLGIRASSTTELSLENVIVPAENILGERGYGFKIAMEVLNSGRLGLAAGCLGGAKRMLALASEHATTRKQFGQAISNFGMIQEKLGQMAVDIFAVECMTYLTCSLVDRGIEDFSIESAICKISGSEMIWSVANEASQIAGGNSYMREYPYEQALRDARINMIFEGTNEILTLFISLSGMKDVGEYLKIVGKALNDPVKSVGVLYGYMTDRLSRKFSGEKLLHSHPELKREAAYFEDYVEDFANVIEKVLQKHRKEIIRKQFVHKRITSLARDLYGMLACISRTSSRIEKDGLENCQKEIEFTKIFCWQAIGRIRSNFFHMDRNVDEVFKKSAAAICEKKGYPTPFFKE